MIICRLQEMVRLGAASSIMRTGKAYAIRRTKEVLRQKQKQRNGSVTSGNSREGEPDTRAVVQIKNNLAAFGHPKAFMLSESGFHWLGDYEITADEVFGGIAPKANKLEQAKQMLRELAETTNMMQSNEIFELAEEQGISKRTLENAKKELEIRAKKINNSWYWDLEVIKQR